MYLDGLKPFQVVPPWLRKFSEVHAVFLGGCVRQDIDGGFPPGSSVIAHAHFEGAICFQRNQYWDPLYPSQTFLHEYAHVATRQGHTRRWYEVFKSFLIRYHGIGLIRDEKHIDEGYRSEYDEGMYQTENVPPMSNWEALQKLYATAKERHYIK